jgi:hypothetical protein
LNFLQLLIKEAIEANFASWGCKDETGRLQIDIYDFFLFPSPT